MCEILAAAAKARGAQDIRAKKWQKRLYDSCTAAAKEGGAYAQEKSEHKIKGLLGAKRSALYKEKST